MKTTLPILVLFVLLAPFKASQLNIKLKPLLDIPDEVDNDFAGFLFEPYEPSPSIPRTCYDSCPCGGEVENCGCGLEKVCGGSFPANLSAKDAIGFHYDASSDDTKYISIKGSVGRTRIEFQGLYDCPVSPGIVEIIGTEIEFDIDDEGLDTSSQSYVYNAGESFIILGKCDGCSQCEIYTRLQFDPQNGWCS